MHDIGAATSTRQKAVDRVCVTVVYAADARDVRIVELTLAPDATIADALASPALAALCLAADRPGLTVAVWGRRAARSRVLTSGDRIELCRPLLIDPKTARRERFARQGARAAGLFNRQGGRLTEASADRVLRDRQRVESSR